MTARLLLLFAFSAAATCQAAIVFSHDDGTAESSLGTGAGTYSIWLNAFQTGSDVSISTISISFGAPPQPADPPGNGAAYTAYLWSDPTNDGDPTDAVVVRSSSGTITNWATDIFNDIAITPYDFSSGDYFYVGFQSTGFAVGRDINSSAGMSWISTDGLTDPLDPNNLSGAVNFGTFDSFGFAGNALIRAEGLAVAVPEPSTYLAGVTALGLGGFVIYRKRRQRRAAEAES